MLEKIYMNITVRAADMIIITKMKAAITIIQPVAADTNIITKEKAAMTMMQPVAVGMIIMCPGMQMTVNVSSAIHMRNIAMFVVKAWKIVSAECLMLIV